MFAQFPAISRPVHTLARHFGRAGLLFLGGCALLSIAAATKKPPASPVNLNTATSEELQEVPGIGPVTAEKILQMRKAYGPFKSVDDLLAIKGIGHKRLEKMRKYLTVGKVGASTRPSAPTSATKPSAAAKSTNLPKTATPQVGPSCLSR